MVVAAYSVGHFGGERRGRGGIGQQTADKSVEGT